MVFKKMLSAFGVGGPSVDTVLTNPNTRPGLTLDGHVNLVGGDSPARIEQINLGLVTRVEIEGGDHEYAGVMEFHRLPVSGAFELAPKQQLSIPFQMPVPWETPITDVYGQRLRGMTMGLRTELAVARAVDKSDLDQVSVHPLPIHERILEAFQALGFRFKNADLERGHIYGVPQTLPFYQEIEFFAAPQYAQTVTEVELTFVTSQQGVEVILECDKRGGFLSAGHDVIGRYSVPHTDAARTDWVQVVDGWLRETTGRYGSMRAQGFGMPHGGGHGYPGHGYAGHGRRGPGMGGVVAGAALGVAGGMIAGEMIEDAFDGGGDDFGDFGEE
ncbi:sporulation protein [Micromonospora sp. WMMA1949]|uniref:sporulation protein n=1 Tax=unclassified Micromonospora TaxID=2617518 RepID=UPI0022B68C20|nr:sporulation protein [Micromonospora sp. WMMA1949]MCZ7424881.1 sporulation protein [Micromonospora sp. WMMA1949]